MLLLLLLLQLLLLVVLLLHSRNNQLRVRHDLGKRARDPRMPGRSIIITIIISITRLMMIAELWAISSQLGLFSLLFGSQLSCANNKLQNKTLRTGSITFNKSDGETADLWLDCMGAQWQIK